MPCIIPMRSTGPSQQTCLIVGVYCSVSARRISTMVEDGGESNRTGSINQRIAASFRLRARALATPRSGPAVLARRALHTTVALQRRI
jgi:hypothetical protein